jgi:hypothetical protein
LTTSTGQYQVDWGDGTVTLHNSNTVAQYQYNFATVSNATLTSRGYKQCMITVTSVSGNLLTCDFQRRFVTSPVQNQPYSTGFLDIILSMPNASSGESIVLGGTTVRHSYCERVRILTIGGVTSLNRFFTDFVCLQSVNLFNTINVTNFNSMFLRCFSIKKIPLYNTENAVTFNSMLQECRSLIYPPIFNLVSATSLNSFTAGSVSIQSFPLYNSVNVTDFTNMIQGCYSLHSLPALPTNAMVTTGTNFALGANSLNRCQMVFSQSVNFTNCQLSRDAIVEIFTNLTDRSATTSANINITANWGASELSAADRLIATSKNWTITG